MEEVRAIRKVKIGILNCETGKVIKEKTVDAALAMQEGEKISRWFDRRETFFSGNPIWEYWEKVGVLGKFKAVARGSSLSSVAAESVAVFKGRKGTEHEFYIEGTE